MLTHSKSGVQSKPKKHPVKLTLEHDAQEADELEELALERVMEIGLTLEDFLRREALEEVFQMKNANSFHLCSLILVLCVGKEQVDTLELQMIRWKRALMSHLADTVK